MKKLTITGNVVKNAEMRYDTTGKAFVVFTVVVDSGTKEYPQTDWVNIRCNGRLVEVAMKHIRKGVKVLVDGYPSVNAYLDHNNNPVSTIKLYAHTLELLCSPITENKEDGTLTQDNSASETLTVIPSLKD